MQHATKYISPNSPSLIRNFWAMVKETEKQFVPSFRRFDVDLTVPSDTQRRRLAAVEAPHEEEDNKVVVVDANSNQDEDDENCGGSRRRAIFCTKVSALVC